jgi:opacity protein-like surface antigen
MRYLSICAAVVCLCSSSSLAQSVSSGQYPKLEIFGGYSANGYFKNDEAANASNPFPLSRFFSDDAGGAKGFETSITRNFNRYLGIKGDFSMYFDSGTARLTVQLCSQGSCTPASGQDFSIHKRAFYVMAGPEIKWRNKTRLTPFAHTLFGVARSTAEVSTASALFSHDDSNSRTGFAAAFGGGLDIRLSKRFSIRALTDYSAVFIGDADAGSSSRRNHVRFSIGIVFGNQ